MIKVIIFDLWNTLCHKKYKKGSTKYLCNEFESPVCDKRKILKAYERTFQLDRKTDLEKKFRRLFKELNLKVDDKKIKKYAKYRYKLETICQNFRYTLPLLRELKKKGYKIAVLSNLTYLSGRIVKKASISGYVDKFFFSYELKSIKPDPKNFNAVLNYFKIKPYEALMIGDNYVDDYLAAKKLGIKAIHLKNEKQLKRDLKKMGML